MARDYNTRAGITPDEKELPYSITTADVESYLNKKMDVICDQIAKKNGTDKEEIDVHVYTTEAGKDFLPFVVVLPMDVLKSKKQKNQNTASIFTPQDSDNACSMKDEYYNVFKPFIYNKDDEQAFFSDEWRRRVRVNRETSPVLKSLRTAKVQRMNGGNTSVVIFMIDPLRVFHDMLKIDGDNRDFHIEIGNLQKINTGNYKYFMKRVINKGKGKKYSNTLADELNRKMKGTRR